MEDTGESQKSREGSEIRNNRELAQQEQALSSASAFFSLLVPSMDAYYSLSKESLAINTLKTTSDVPHEI